MHVALNQFDVNQPRNEHLFSLPTRIGELLTTHLMKRREADSVFIVYVMVNILLTTLPCAIGLYCLEGKVSAGLMVLLGAFYLGANFLIYARSFVLGLHYSTHVPVFNKQWHFLNQINTSILCVLFGIPPWMYYAHHVAMHHCENNMADDDLSSTMPYQRDSKRDHFIYMLRFVVAIWVELPLYLIRKRRYRIASRCVAGELLFFAMAAVLFEFKPLATIFVLILPTLIMSFSLMQGNWKQHIFVDPDDPTNNYRSTYTCINTPTNALNFNDGYHIEHHENPSVSWHRLPMYFQKQLANYALHDGLIFTGIGSTEVGRLVLNGQLEQLADHYLNVGQKQRTKAELIEEFQKRLQPIQSSSRMVGNF